MNLEDKNKVEFMLVNKIDLKEELRLSIIEIMSEIQSKEKIWITTQETMEMLNIKSKTTLNSLKDKGFLEYTQPFKKLILYKRESVLEYLEKHSQKIF